MTLTDECLNEEIDYGGIKLPRGEVYKRLWEVARSTGHPHPGRLVDTWMFANRVNEATKCQVS